MTSKELVKQALESWRFPVLEENESTIVIRYQMNYVHIAALNEESNGIAVLLTNIFSVEDQQEELLGLKTCNELNYRMMQAKFYIDSDNDLVISSEFFYKTEDDVEALLKMSLLAVVTGKKRFVSKYKEIEAEYKLLQELNEQG